MGESLGEIELSFHLTALRIKHEREYVFHPTRKWRFDFAIPKYMLAIEVEGGVYTRGRHQRPTGFIKDMEKYNAAASLGWTVLRFTPQQVKKGEAINAIDTFLQDK